MGRRNSMTGWRILGGEGGGICVIKIGGGMGSGGGMSGDRRVRGIDGKIKGNGG